MRSRRGFGAVVRAVRKNGEAARLARLGMSDAMWDALEDLHLARLNKERGRRRRMNDRTLQALSSRGLATWTPAPVPCPHCDGSACTAETVLWSATPEGKELAMRGRDAS